MGIRHAPTGNIGYDLSHSTKTHIFTSLVGNWTLISLYCPWRRLAKMSDAVLFFGLFGLFFKSREIFVADGSVEIFSFTIGKFRSKHITLTLYALFFIIEHTLTSTQQNDAKRKFIFTLRVDGFKKWFARATVSRPVTVFRP